MFKSVLYIEPSYILALGSYLAMIFRPHDLRGGSKHLGLDRENDHVPLF
jgi:hypothetical protein